MGAVNTVAILWIGAAAVRFCTGYYGILRDITGYYGILRDITGYYGIIQVRPDQGRKERWNDGWNLRGFKAAN